MNKHRVRHRFNSMTSGIAQADVLLVIRETAERQRETAWSDSRETAGRQQGDSGETVGTARPSAGQVHGRSMASGVGEGDGGENDSN